MYTSVLALLSRSLRMDVRSRGTHLVRLVLLAGIYLSLTQTQLTGSMFGAPGLQLFRSILWLNLIFATLIGIGAFSSVITEEKEEDSLGLIKMAGVDSVGLLLGKVGGRLIQALALLIVQYPFTLLSITLGGVGAVQIRAAYIALAAYLVMLAGLGVLCSTITSSSRVAARLMVILLILYGIVPAVCLEALAQMASAGKTTALLPVLQILSTSCIFQQTGEILTTGFQSPTSNVQVVSNVLVGIASFLAAWSLFEICTRNSGVEPSSRGLVSHKTSGFRWFNPGRLRGNAMVWKEFYFAIGGIAGLLLRLGCYVGLSVPIAFSCSWDRDSTCAMFLASAMFLLPFDASLLISKSLQDEMRGQTIPALVMLPYSIPAILYPKLGGALLGLLPGLACCGLAGCGLIWKLLTENHGFPNNSAPSMMIFYCVAIYVGTNMLLLPHLTAAIALTVRWGATPLAIGAFYAITLVESMIMMCITFFVFRATNPESYIVVLALINVGLCVRCQFEMIRRFRNLAEK